MLILEKPVLFLIFNRPENTKKVFLAIRQARPKQLFIAADGPRLNNEADRLNCQLSRAVVADIDWDCEVKTLFREENLGCGEAVRSALDWFFSQVEAGIVLEDDCLPNETFFNFCSAMLEKYDEDERVMMINGTNQLGVQDIMPESYFFSRCFMVWGWATWKRAWRMHDPDMSEWPAYRNQKYLQKVFSNKNVSYYYQDSFERVYAKKVDTWDSQWVFSCLYSNGLAISPRYNLVSNIGAVGTHTQEGPDASLYKETRNFDCSNISYLNRVTINYRLEDLQFENSGLTKFNVLTKIIAYLRSKF